MNSSYDFVMAGAGAAGLSLAVHLVLSGKFNDKRILLIDRDEKKTNDRTWCFWEQGPGPFECLVSRRWRQAWFHGKDDSKLLDLSPYEYKLIKGLDFYEYCLSLLKTAPNVDFIHGEIEQIMCSPEGASCRVNGKQVTARYIFSSIYEKPSPARRGHYLLQHFLGWHVKTSTAIFDPAEAVLMDFRVPQQEGTTFVYVLPFSSGEALVEFTLFSGRVLDRSQYAEGLKDYMSSRFPAVDYSITEEEFGVIPMTDHAFPPANGNIIYTGTAGGQTKPSTGYTFSFIQKHSREILQCLLNNLHPANAGRSPGRFGFYDRTFLEVLERRKPSGDQVFERLFMRNSPANILKFLSNETRLSEELRLLGSLPFVPFLKAALKVK